MTNSPQIATLLQSLQQKGYSDLEDILTSIFNDPSKIEVIVSEDDLKATSKSSDNTSANDTSEKTVKFDNKTPREIKEYLDQYVIGQDHAKKVLAVGVYNHYQRLNAPSGDRYKSNILLVGPSGSGKTFLVEKIAELLDVPVAFADATTLTQAGYVGEDVESVIVKLYHKAGKRIDRAERGIVFIDEFDKITRKQSTSNSPDVGGVGVQQAILKMLEGSEVNFSPEGAMKGSLLGGQNKVINTKNILFICAGAFVGIEKVIKARVSPNRKRIGFSDETVADFEGKQDYNDLINHINSDDLIKYGFIPEVIGRIPVIAGLQKLEVADLYQILTTSKKSILKEFQAVFKDFNVKLLLTKQAIEEIAQQAIKREVGARGLRAIVEGILLDSMFDLPSLPKNQRPPVVLIAKNQVVNKTALYGLTQAFIKDYADELDEKTNDIVTLVEEYRFQAKKSSSKAKLTAPTTSRATAKEDTTKKVASKKPTATKKPVSKKASSSTTRVVDADTTTNLTK